MSALRKKVNSLLAEYKLASAQTARETAEVEELSKELAAAMKAQELIQAAAKSVQDSAHKQIAGVVTRCLQAVFGAEAYEFRIEFERKRGKTEARLVFLENGNEVDPRGGCGGGVLDVAAFALKLVSLALARPHKRKLLILDEPLKHLSVEYRPAAADLLLTLAREMGFQIIMATHSDQLKIGKVINLNKSKV